MPRNWDCFVDEVKNGGALRGIGLLALERGVLEGLDAMLEAPIAKVEGKGTIVGELHWSCLGNLDAQIAKQWLTSFFQAPFAFFVNARASSGELKAALIAGVVRHLGGDPRVPGGFDPGCTTIHLDADRSDGNSILATLRTDARLLRAFKWNSKGSRLLQLADLLLGVSGLEPTPPGASNCADLSKGATRKAEVLAHAQSEAKRFALQNKRNAVLELVDGELKWLLSEQDPSQVL